MSMDYFDLNEASPKDDILLMHIDVLVGNTASHAIFSFMDGFSIYNQIKMTAEDKGKHHLSLHGGHFAIKSCVCNVGATYQRVMTALFHDMIHYELKCM